jgi:nucleotide-binding universal stress UspA family protein
MFNKILVPLDGSELSESSLNYVVAIATGCRVPEVILVRVRDFLDPVAIKSMSAQVAERIDEAYQKEAETYLKTIADTLNKKGVNARCEVLSGNPAEEIMKYSQSNKVDLIIMSTHGRTGVSRWVWGSVADKVIKSSTVPVLINPTRNKAV